MTAGDSERVKAQYRSVEPQAPFALGEVFAGRYLVERLLGVGGMGAVYRASDVVLGEPIALKVLLADERGAGASILRFRQEVRLARRVTHPNVARVFDLGEHDNVVFMTMELIDGPTLRQRISGETRPSASAGLAIVEALAEGVAAAHAVGVLHRDLKPSNVMIEKKSGRVVITDFGIAHAVDDPNDLTVGAIGTPSYMAPEQLAGAPANERTDIYQLGIVAHEVLVGALPKRGAVIAERDFVAASVPARAAAILARCLEVDADQRPESVAKVALTLASGVRELTDAPSKISVTTAVPPSSNGDEPTVAAPAPRRSTLGSNTGVQSLAVMPFRARGIDIESAGEAFTDEVLDQLSRTRGLRVFAAAATRGFAVDCDPRAAALALGADLVVQGSISRQGERLLYNVRLIEGRSVVQLWSDRFETGVTALIEAAETIARRVAETLRVEILVRARPCPLSEEAASAYFSARRRLRIPETAAIIEARDTFARCLEMEPAFLPAYAGHATASLRCWFLLDDPHGELVRAAEWSIERALARAPEMAETHLASAVHSVQHGAYPAAVRALERALAIAPMYAEAHEYLGMLEAEAGSRAEGPNHLDRALELDPTLVNARLALAREREIRGDHLGCDALVEQVERTAPAAMGPTGLRLRLAIWRRDNAAIARQCADVAPRDGAFELLRVCGETALGRRTTDEAISMTERLLSVRTNPRFVSLVLQIMAEAAASVEDDGRALAAIDGAVRAGLIDLRWLEGCPLLARLRAEHRLDGTLQIVRVRAAALFH